MYSPRSANLSRTINCGTQRSVDKKRNKLFLTFKHLFDIISVIRLANKEEERQRELPLPLLVNTTHYRTPWSRLQSAQAMSPLKISKANALRFALNVIADLLSGLKMFSPRYNFRFPVPESEDINNDIIYVPLLFCKSYLQNLPLEKRGRFTIVYGFQVYPQLPQRFTVDPLPRNPHRSE